MFKLLLNCEKGFIEKKSLWDYFNDPLHPTKKNMLIRPDSYKDQVGGGKHRRRSMGTFTIYERETCFATNGLERESQYPIPILILEEFELEIYRVVKFKYSFLLISFASVIIIVKSRRVAA